MRRLHLHILFAVRAYRASKERRAREIVASASFYRAPDPASTKVSTKLHVARFTTVRLTRDALSKRRLAPLYKGQGQPWIVFKCSRVASLRCPVRYVIVRYYVVYVKIITWRACYRTDDKTSPRATAAGRSLNRVPRI